ncbi:MAG: ATP-dependent DNA helicase RecG, partial [Phaeodactylibacter sp.]|nr:ATP-dependent DNA helicase RecG [Phaeodactylibacter sp.]
MVPQMSMLDSDISYLKGVGPKRAELLNKELGIFTCGDLLQQFPHRYIDKTQFHSVNMLHQESGEVQLRGILRRLVAVGEGRKKRLTARFRDDTGAIDLVWFSGVSYLQNQLEVGKEYVIYGRVNAFRDKLSIPHPEMEPANPEKIKKAASFAPVYPSTEKLNTKGLDARNRRRIMATLLERLRPEA